MRSNKINIAAQRRSISQLFEKTTAYKVPVIKYTRHSVRSTRCFACNKQGSTSTLRNSAMRYHDVG